MEDQGTRVKCLSSPPLSFHCSSFTTFQVQAFMGRTWNDVAPNLDQDQTLPNAHLPLQPINLLVCEISSPRFLYILLSTVEECYNSPPRRSLLLTVHLLFQRSWLSGEAIPRKVVRLSHCLINDDPQDNDVQRNIFTPSQG
jgi:hypothetical protein